MEKLKTVGAVYIVCGGLSDPSAKHLLGPFNLDSLNNHGGEANALKRLHAKKFPLPATPPLQPKHMHANHTHACTSH